MYFYKYEWGMNAEHKFENFKKVLLEIEQFIPTEQIKDNRNTFYVFKETDKNGVPNRDFLDGNNIV